MLTSRELMEEASCRLTAAGVENTREAVYIFEYVFGKRHFDPSLVITEEKTALFRKLIGERCEGVPYQYITGRAPFLDMDLNVGPGVLIPRPETEVLAEKAAEIIITNSLSRALDLCSGTGCIAIAVSRLAPSCRVTCIEKSMDAYKYLLMNCREFASGTECLNEDLFSYLPVHPEEFDIITCNPPYLTGREMDELQKEVRREPREALFGGEDGLDFYRNMKPLIEKALKKGGFIAFEGGDGQLEAIRDIYLENGSFEGEISCDQFGMKRFFIGKKQKTVQSDS